MANHSLSIGTRVKHPLYGAGIILDNSMQSAYNITFKHHGEKSIPKDFEDLEIIELAPLPDERIGLGDLQKVITQVLRDWSGFSELVKLGDRWKGGTMILQPADPNQKPKEIPIETLFHKIVMIRDRIRVLEQNINKSPNLSSEEKVHIQQYITRTYGSLTTFNILFKDKDDAFKGDGK